MTISWKMVERASTKVYIFLIYSTRAFTWAYDRSSSMTLKMWPPESASQSATARFRHWNYHILKMVVSRSIKVYIFLIYSTRALIWAYDRSSSMTLKIWPPESARLGSSEVTLSRLPILQELPNFLRGMPFFKLIIILHSYKKHSKILLI